VSKWKAILAAGLLTLASLAQEHPLQEYRVERYELSRKDNSFLGRLVERANYELSLKGDYESIEEREEKGRDAWEDLGRISLRIIGDDLQKLDFVEEGIKHAIEQRDKHLRVKAGEVLEGRQGERVPWFQAQAEWYGWSARTPYFRMQSRIWDRTLITSRLDHRTRLDVRISYLTEEPGIEATIRHRLTPDSFLSLGADWEEEETRVVLGYQLTW